MVDFIVLLNIIIFFYIWLMYTCIWKNMTYRLFVYKLLCWKVFNYFLCTVVVNYIHEEFEERWTYVALISMVCPVFLQVLLYGHIYSFWWATLCDSFEVRA